MTIEPFRTDDIASFMLLAASENWVAETWEFELLLSEFSPGCFVARGELGETAGFITSLRHEQSGWIGNLIVAAEQRGRGIGESLFVNSLKALWSVGVETVWLTASKSGRSLYEKHGFTSIDTVNRWVGIGGQQGGAHGVAAGHAGVTDAMRENDYQAWGDVRESLLSVTAGRGVVQSDESGFLVQQPCGAAVQFGPFSAANDSSAERLFGDASANCMSGTKILLDAPESNRAAELLFTSKKMRIAGSNCLMYAGIKPHYRPELIYGLATMGSCG
jgi:N-acetylglutamate synthase-like GNAT family acetyltransferase